jgi:hypothetical protein
MANGRAVDAADVLRSVPAQVSAAKNVAAYATAIDTSSGATNVNSGGIRVALSPPADTSADRSTPAARARGPSPSQLPNQVAPTGRRPGRDRQGVRAPRRGRVGRVSRGGLSAVVDHPAPDVVGHPPETAAPGEGISCATCANWGTPSPLAGSYPGLA